jgi:F-type H+-transporting ATPase subunit b
MAKVALPRIGTIIEERRKHIDAHLAEAQRFKEQSDAAIVAHDKKLVEARLEAQTVANTVRQQKAVEAEESRTLLEAQLRKKLADAEQSIATATICGPRGVAYFRASAVPEPSYGGAPRGAANAPAGRAAVVR